MPGNKAQEMFYLIKAKLRERLHLDPVSVCSNYMGVPCLDVKGMNDNIAMMIKSGKPFMVTRFGGTELFAMRTAEFLRTDKMEKAIKNMGEWSGFFPNDTKLLYRFNELMKEDCRQVDVLGVWYLTCEDYYMKHYCTALKSVGNLMSLEPWNVMDNPWTSALRGKKVLVIHPFEKTIREQYAKHEKLFVNPELLPEFTLLTLKAVQTSGSATDERFETWFDALDYMCGECEKLDFDVALIGCGAYGFPLAAHIKRMGRQAIHLGGVLQILFGIKGRRWDESDTHLMYNEHWVYPDKSEIPAGAEKVENACYWEVKKEDKELSNDV